MKRIILAMALSVIFTIATSAQSIHYERGYAKSIGLNACIVKKDFDVPSAVSKTVQDDNLGRGVSLQTFQGYNLGNGLAIGALTGIEYHYNSERRLQVPTVLQLSYHFLNKKVSPFVSGGFGTNFLFEEWPFTFNYTANISVGVDLGKWSVHYILKPDFNTHNPNILFDDVASMLGCSFYF